MQIAKYTVLSLIHVNIINETLPIGCIDKNKKSIRYLSGFDEVYCLTELYPDCLQYLLHQSNNDGQE